MNKEYAAVEEPVVTSFTISRADKAALIARAKATERSVAGEIRVAIREHLAQTKDNHGSPA
jgi:hypothetical protein